MAEQAPSMSAATNTVPEPADIDVPTLAAGVAPNREELKQLIEQHAQQQQEPTPPPLRRRPPPPPPPTSYRHLPPQPFDNAPPPPPPNALLSNVFDASAAPDAQAPLPAQAQAPAQAPQLQIDPLVLAPGPMPPPPPVPQQHSSAGGGIFQRISSGAAAVASAVFRRNRSGSPSPATTSAPPQQQLGPSQAPMPGIPNLMSNRLNRLQALNQMAPRKSRQPRGDEPARLACAILTKAAELPLHRRHELIDAAAELPQLAQLIRPGSTPAAGASKPPADPANATPAKPDAPPLPSLDELAKILDELYAKVKSAPTMTTPSSQPQLPAEAEAAQIQAPPPAEAAAEAKAEATAEATAEVTAEVTAEAKAEVTAEATAEAVGAKEEGAKAPGDALQLAVIPEYEQYGMTNEAVRAVVSIKAVAEVVTRARVALTCVLDRSGSMSGQPIELVQETAHFLIDQLTDNDYLGLVSYSGTVREDLPLCRMTGPVRQLAHVVVEDIEADGSTALYAGLEEGVRQQMDAQQAFAKAGGEAARLVHSCFLFTDGQATDGRRSPEEIMEGLKELQAPEATHVTVHTFGFSEGHSVELLQAVADAQSGVYYYIRDADDIAGGFGDALGGLLSVVAKDVRVAVRPAPGVALFAFRSGGRVIGATAAANPTATLRRRTTATSQQGPGLAAALAAAAVVPSSAVYNDMFAEETRETLIVLDLPAALPPGSVAVAEVDLEYTDVAAAHTVRRSTALLILRSPDPRPADALPSELVFVTAARFETLDAIEAAQRAAEAAGGEDLTGAHELLDAHLGRLTSAPRALQTPQLQALSEETRAARQSIKKRSELDHAAQGAMANAMQGLKQQRIGTSTMTSADHHASYDHKCKAAFRQSTTASVQMNYASKRASAPSAP